MVYYEVAIIIKQLTLNTLSGNLHYNCSPQKLLGNFKFYSELGSGSYLDQGAEQEWLKKLTTSKDATHRHCPVNDWIIHICFRMT